MAEKTYKIRTSTSGPSKRTVYRLTLPPELAQQVPEDTLFTPELVEEGILYRRVETAQVADSPSWVKR